MKFDEIVNLDGRELYVSGSYEQKKEVGEHVIDSFSNGYIHEQDIFDYITTPSLVHVTEVFEYNDKDEEIGVDLTTLDIPFIRNLVANQLNNVEL
jgi:hypothetical protein